MDHESGPSQTVGLCVNTRLLCVNIKERMGLWHVSECLLCECVSATREQKPVA
jgi:hypothetical protein